MSIIDTDTMVETQLRPSEEWDGAQNTTEDSGYTAADLLNMLAVLDDITIHTDDLKSARKHLEIVTAGMIKDIVID